MKVHFLQYHRAPALSACTILLILITGLATPVSAQQARESNRVYLRAHIGFSQYTGDLSATNTTIHAVGVPALGWEAGYQLTPNLGIAAALQAADYPSLNPSNDWHTWRFTSQMLLQYQFLASDPIAPYLRIGAHVTTGSNIESGTARAFGPMFGMGIRYAIHDRISLFLEGNVHTTFPDHAIDGISGDRGFDTIGFAGIGIRFTLASPPPVALAHVETPDTLEVEQAGIFTAARRGNVSGTVAYRWSFGDGTTAPGPTARHTYMQVGRYDATVTVTDGRSSDSKTVHVIVTRAVNASLTAACMQALEAADTAYRTRHFSAATDSLSVCLNNENVATAGKVKAYRLRTLIHLKQGEIEPAKNMLLQLFALKPDYEADPIQDPPSYVSLVSIVKRQLETGSITVDR